MINDLKDFDIFIHQKISNSYRGERWSSDYLKKQTNGRCIWLFNYFFRGYAQYSCLPTRCVDCEKNEKVTKKRYNFRAMLFYLFSIGKSPEEAKYWLNEIKRSN